MPLLADAAQRDPHLLRVAAALAANVNVGRPFAQALLAFLVNKRLPTLQQPASKACALPAVIGAQASSNILH